VGSPKAPSRLAVKSVRATVAVLGWKDNARNETGFRLERKVGRGRYKEIQSLPANTTQVTVGDLAPGTTYSFRVRALNAAGFSAYTDVVKVRTPAGG
jgi:titin